MIDAPACGECGEILFRPSSGGALRCANGHIATNEKKLSSNDVCQCGGTRDLHAGGRGAAPGGCPGFLIAFDMERALLNGVNGAREVDLLAKYWLPHMFADPDFKACLEACDKILATKGHDYTQGNPERLANFYEAAAFLNQSPFQVWATYFYKHCTAIFSFTKHGRVESEPIEGRIHDAVNYLLLLSKMVRREKAK